jgi:hypothetical protein
MPLLPEVNVKLTLFDDFDQFSAEIFLVFPENQCFYNNIFCIWSQNLHFFGGNII